MPHEPKKAPALKVEEVVWPEGFFEDTARIISERRATVSQCVGTVIPGVTSQSYITRQVSDYLVKAGMLTKAQLRSATLRMQNYPDPKLGSVKNAPDPTENAKERPCACGCGQMVRQYKKFPADYTPECYRRELLTSCEFGNLVPDLGITQFYGGSIPADISYFSL